MTVVDYATRLSQSPLALESLDGGKGGTGDALGSYHHPLHCFPVRPRAVAIPYCDTVGKDAIDGAAVELHQKLRRQTDFI